MTAIRKAAADANQQLETQKNTLITSATQSMIDSGLSILSTGFGELPGIYKAAFAASKAYAIAQALVSIQQGIAMAAANPFPYNLVAMASVAASTASIVSDISSISMKARRIIGSTPGTLELWDRHVLDNSWGDFPDCIVNADILDLALNREWPKNDGS